MPIRSSRVAGALVALALCGSGCTVSAVDGTPVPPSAPVSTSTSSRPTAFPSSAGGGPVTAAGDPSVQTEPDTAIGDPRLLDLCPRRDEFGPLTKRLDRAFVARDEPTYAYPDAAGSGEPGQCTFSVRDLRTYDGATTVGYLNAVSSDAEPRLPSGTRQERRGGLPVLVAPVGREGCERFVRLRGVTLQAYVAVPHDPADKGFPCRGADFILARAIDEYQGDGFPARPVAARTIAVIDLCRTLDERDAARLLGTDTATELVAAFGAYCHWRTSTYDLYVTSSWTQDYGKIDGTHRVIGGHALVYDDEYNDGSSCRYSSEQGAIDALRAVEFLDIEVYPARTTGRAAALCDIAGQAAVRILDAAGLQ